MKTNEIFGMKLKKYKFSFHGRQTGAIGITYDIAQEYMAESLAEAVSKLFVDYEIFRYLKLNGKPFEIKSIHLDHPAIKKYKGLGMLRK